MARSAHLTTTTSAVAATLLAGGSASTFYGIVATNVGNVVTYYVKLYWEGTGVAPSRGAQTTTVPAAGTAIPHLTIPVQYGSATTTNGIVWLSTVPLNNGGRIWYWISTLAADTDTTVLATAGDVVTLIYD
jgi:hypothetical protein